jgi:hypothetical protein
MIVKRMVDIEKSWPVVLSGTMENGAGPWHRAARLLYHPHCRRPAVVRIVRRGRQDSMPDSETRPEPHAPRSRLEDEVLEILTRADRPPTWSERLTRAARDAERPLRVAAHSLPRNVHVGPGLLLLASFVFALVGSALGGRSGLLGFLFGLASFVCLVLLWVPRFSAGSGPKRWRGRDLGPTPTNAQWLDELRDRFRRPPRP